MLNFIGLYKCIRKLNHTIYTWYFCVYSTSVCVYKGTVCEAGFTWWLAVDCLEAAGLGTARWWRWQRIASPAAIECKTKH